MVKNFGKNVSKSSGGKYKQGMLAARQNLFNHAKQPAKDALTTSSERVIQKTAGAASDLICNKNANEITKVSKCSQQNNLGTVTNENDKELPTERYMSPEKGQKIIDNLKLKL